MFPPRSVGALLLALCVLSAPAGCCHPQITAVSLSNPCEPDGIPFYLPKPLLIVAKNFRYLEEAKVGLTDTAPIPTGYDDQGKYADLNARAAFNGEATSFPGEGKEGATNSGAAMKSEPRIHSAGGPPVTLEKAPKDDLSPEVFYTYQVIFVPDLTQKYGLRIKGGVGEIRAAMNLVNGWQFTGLGPYYMKDSSTAQNLLAGGIAANLTGRGIGDVVKNVADLAGKLQTGERDGRTFDAGDRRVTTFIESMQQLDLNRQPMVIPDFAQIHVYEPYLAPGAVMEWREIVSLNYAREVFGSRVKEVRVADATPAVDSGTAAALQSGERGGTTPTMNADLARRAVERVLNLPSGSPALRSAGQLQAGERGQLQAGERAAAGGAHADASVKKEFKFFCFDGFGHGHEKPRRPVISVQQTSLPAMVSNVVPTDAVRPEGDVKEKTKQAFDELSKQKAAVTPPMPPPTVVPPADAAPPRPQ